MLVINQTDNTVVDKRTVVRAIVHIQEGIIEFGWCSKQDPLLVRCYIFFDGVNCQYIRKTTDIDKYFIYSNRQGCYIYSENLTAKDILYETHTFGRGGFPYCFNKEYEAVNCFDIFNGKQRVLQNIEYPLSKYLQYSFGAEFETYSGYVPEELCFRDGLIPLRDGSLEGGIEYSTVVLRGNSGLNLLKQQIDTLKDYTYFNKECSLHFHFGGYPVSAKHIWALYLIWKTVEGEITTYIPEYSFHTARYKNSRKDYCLPIPKYLTFGQLYAYLASQKYFGSLTQNHPADPDKRAKWNIHSRYHNLNLVNMVCYKSPKTVEFRFLRPTFNYHKITLWLYIFNAIMSYSESCANSVSDVSEVKELLMHKSINLEHILYTVYPSNIVEILLRDLSLLKIAVENQYGIQDYIGMCTELEDKLIDPNIII